MNGIEDKQVEEDSDQAVLYVQDKEEKKLEQMQILNEPKTKIKNNLKIGQIIHFSECLESYFAK